ncbi:transposase domain-containing protein, partial [Enterobacter hormaechei]
RLSSQRSSRCLLKCSAWVRILKRAAAIMSLIQSARNNGHDPYAYLKDVLTRLPSL